jgi:hypothetical protein
MILTAEFRRSEKPTVTFRKKPIKKPSAGSPVVFAALMLPTNYTAGASLVSPQKTRTQSAGFRQYYG